MIRPHNAGLRRKQAQSPKFLKNPAEIRAMVKELQGGTRLDLAVAFAGADWWELLADHRGPLRVICWLSSTNTNPHAVEDMINRRMTEVRQRDFMHCKVYLASRIGAIVGSANLSKAALAEDQNAGQDEAAVLLTRTATVRQVQRWFEDLWRDSRPIRQSDIVYAKNAWSKARLEKRRIRGNVPSRMATHVPPLPAKFDPIMLSYAKKVRFTKLRTDIGKPCRLVQSIAPATFTTDQQKALVEQIVSWTKHPGSYNNFLAQPIVMVRKGLVLLFDDGKDPESRLEEIGRSGYLEGLRIPTISLLLYWRNPERFPPYNFKTIAFLRDFGLIHRGLSAASPVCYERWRRWATRLAQQPRLPTPGHVDRLVVRYYEDNYGSELTNRVGRRSRTLEQDP